MVAVVGAVSAALISLGYSAYQQQVPTKVPQVEAGAPVETGRWRVSVLRGSAGSVLPSGLNVSPGKKALTLEMTLENVSSESSNLYGDLIVLADVPDAPRPTYYLLRDNEILWDLQPRMPEAVAAVWELPAEMDVPKDLRIIVEGVRFKPRDNLYAAPGWFPAGQVAEINLPVEVQIGGVP
ncbi:hypothetical protein VW35_03295 [Devosia soli]|uniref:DUF4352 domain-containing protein n=1 Tax=Devosia soli TaxID=361041 RepID=A0A0F5LFV8_9HYPH|nr:hypothetical protein [Devosia soli]KKB81180.1 hypothetical protein VW35_03295 [Devosia soli]